MYTEKEIKKFEAHLQWVLKLDLIRIRKFINNLSEKEKDIIAQISAETAHEILKYSMINHLTFLTELILKNSTINLKSKISKKFCFFDELTTLFKIWDPSICKKLIGLILENPNFDINQQNQNGDTLLHICAKNNFIELVQKILEKENIDVNFLNKDFQSPLFCATAYENQEIIKILRKTNGINKEIFEYRPALLFFDAIENKFFNIIKLIIDYFDEGLKYFYDRELNPLLRAIQTEDIVTVKFVLSLENIDINFKSPACNPALHSAAYDSDVNILLLLLNTPGIDTNIVNENNETALYKAARGEKLENVRILLAQPNIDVNPIPNDGFYKGVTIFQLAVKKNNKELVKILLQQDDVDFTLTDVINSNPDHWVHQMIEERNIARIKNMPWYEEDVDASIESPQVKLLAEESSDEEVSDANHQTLLQGDL